jgi:hypothetical protein
MSQSGSYNAATSNPQIPIDFVTDSGTAIASANIINVFGAGGTTTSGAGNTITINSTSSAMLEFTTDVSGPVDPTAGGIVNVTGATNIFSDGSVVNTLRLNLQGTNHALFVGRGTNTSSSNLAVGSNGQVLIAATGADPKFSTITSSGGTITFTPGANSLNIEAGGAVPTTFTANTGTATPALNNLNVLGTGSITISGSGSTLTTQLTGLTNHAIQIGAGTATLTQLGAGTTGQVLQTNTGADPTWSTATYPSTTTINQILYSSAANTVTGLATSNRGVLTTGAAGVPVITALATDGQLIIGSTAGAPAAATLTQGTGITITNASNSITIAVSGSVVGQTITGQSGGALSPTAGNWNILGASTAAGTSPVTSSGSGSTLTINVQKSQAIAATDATKVGVCNFNSAQFTVDANGFVSTIPDAALLDYKLVFMFGGM